MNHDRKIIGVVSSHGGTHTRSDCLIYCSCSSMWWHSTYSPGPCTIDKDKMNRKRGLYSEMLPCQQLSRTSTLSMRIASMWWSLLWTKALFDVSTIFMLDWQEVTMISIGVTQCCKTITPDGCLDLLIPNESLKVFIPEIQMNFATHDAMDKKKH
jgi:hypothetical protein